MTFPQGREQGLVLTHRLVPWVMVLVLTGCASFSGYPHRHIPADAVVVELRATLTRGQVTACLAEEAIACRNSIIAAGMYGIDAGFAQFEKRLFQENREVSFLATLATLGLTTAGALTGTAPLSAISAGIIGTKSAFDTEVLFDRAILAIHTQMRAQRDRMAVRLRQGLRQEITVYPLLLALTDLEGYYQAGTLLSAFVGITAAAGVQADHARAALDRVLRSVYTETATSRVLEQWLFDAQGTPILAHVQRLEAWLVEHNIGLHASSFLHSDAPHMEAERQRAITELQVPSLKRRYPGEDD